MIEKFWTWFNPLKWYWKVLVILLFWWLFIPLYIWTQTDLEKPVKWAITAIIAIVFLFSMAKSGDITSSLNPKPSSTTESSGNFVGNRNSRKLHNLDHGACQNYVNQMNESNKVFFDSESEANAAGYYACKKCY